MEGLGDHESEDNKAHLETNKKRRFKTPFQVQALEEFYNEHKYPTDAAKAELAEKLGLSEKQISGWFCHRRLKDRRLLSEEGNTVGKQELSSGVIQDHASGLRQDSCGSTKQGDQRLTDAREVESRRLCNEELPLPDLHYEQRKPHYDATEMDDTSSESNSALQDGFHSRMDNVMEMEAPVPHYVMPSEFLPKSRGRMGPSGYLKIKGQTENVAVTAVKRQLGRNYLEDGPPLGVDFDPLPPGAFESPPTGNAVQEPYRSAERIPVSLDVRGACWPPNLKSDPHPHLEAMKLKLAHVSEQDIHLPSPRQVKKKSYQGSAFRTQKPCNEDAYVTEEKADYDRNINPRVRERGYQSMKSELLSKNHHIRPSSGTIKEEKPWLNDHDGMLNPVGLHKRPGLQSRDPDMKPRYKDPPDEDDIFLPYRMVAVRPNAGKVCGERGKMRDQQTPMGTMKRVPSQLKTGKKERHILQREKVTARSSLHEITQSTLKPVRRPEMDMPSSFSEDETAETSSSVD